MILRNKVKRIASLALFLCSFSAFAEKGPVYISPNNDGVQDQLEVPLQIKEKRYVAEWSFIISDEKGNIVRIIGNKDKRPDTITVGTFFSQLFTPKEGVEIPATVIWNGYFDDGSLAPDGTYYYQFTATDDNGNTATTSKLKVIVDCTAPRIQLTQPSESDKTFGEGAKSTLHITQTGSSETQWIGTIVDNENNVRKTFKWTQSAPLSLDWDGTDDNGSIVPDGVYSYRVTATDEAGNTSDAAQITNIIYSGEKPAVSISIASDKYFSPNKDGVKDTLELAVSIAKPASKTNSLVSWKVDIVRVSDGKIVRSYSGKDNAPASIVFDGTDSSGKVLEEGQYFAQVNAKYLNGYDSGIKKSPVFVLDVTAPVASVSVEGDTFSPDGDGSQDALLIMQRQEKPLEPEWTGTKEWVGKITSSSGAVVKTFNYGSTPEARVLWFGETDDGSLAADGSYSYTLSVTEKSGNTASFSTKAFTLDTSKTELALSASVPAFSRNSASSIQSVSFVPHVKAASGIKTYELTISDKDGKTVYTVSGTGSVPPSIVWNGLDSNGKACADGTYTATLQTVANNGTHSKASRSGIVLDSLAPSISLTAPYILFSPDGISSKQTIPFSVATSNETKWTGTIVSEEKTSLVRTYTWQGTVPNFDWDGTDEKGNVVTDGSYTLTITATDAAGNTGSAKIQHIKVDTREAKAYVTADYDAISPNGDGFRDSQKFVIKAAFTDSIESWSFSILSALTGRVERAWTNDDFKLVLPATIEWDGKDSKGVVYEGSVLGKLNIVYAKGNSVEAVSAPFVCTATPPKLSVQTSPRYFSPDNDGNDDDLFIKLGCVTKAKLSSWSFVINDPNGREFWRTSGKSAITEQLVWDGRGSNGELVQSAMDYPYVFTVTDELGMTSTFEGKINVDVLVIRVGDVLKMQVPSIIFRSDSADFGMAGQKDADGRTITSGITAEQKANNERVLKRIAEILKKFEDYNVTIVGHANRLTDNPNEETVDNPSQWGPALIPLSLRRAEYVRQQLVGLGISSGRLSVEGKGGTEPVANTKDRAVNWKNRRVEFILNK